jgi:hypothetical protein
MYPLEFSSGTMHSTNSPETCARHTRISLMCLMVLHRLCTTPAGLRGGSGPLGENPNYTGLDVIIVHDDKIAALYVFLDPPLVTS